MKKKMIPQNLLHYIMIYTVITIVSISVVGGYLYLFCYRTVYSEFMLGNKQYLMSIASEHENDMQAIENTVVQLGMTDDATRFIMTQQPEKAVKLKGYLKRYTTVSSFYNMIFYHYAEDDYLYNHSTVFGIERFLKRERIFNDMSNEEFGEILEEKSRELQIISEQEINSSWLNGYTGNDTSTTMFIQRISPEFDETVIFFIPSGYYDNLLSDEIYSKCIAWLYKDGKVIVSRGESEITKEELQDILPKEEREEQLEVDQVSQEVITIRGNQYLLSQEKGSSGICYATLQPMEVFHDKLYVDQWVAILLVFSCLVVAVFVIVFFSGHLMRKVKKVNVLLSDKDFYNLNNIEEGIQTLVNIGIENEKENLPLKKSKFIRNFIRGDVISKETAVAEAEKAQLNVNYDMYIVVLLRNKETNNEDLLYSSLITLLENAKDMSGYGIYLVGKNQSLFVLFGNSRETLDGMLEQILKMRKTFSQKFVIAASNYHTDFLEGSRAYLEADTAFDHHLLMNNDKVIRFQDIFQNDYDDLLPEDYLKRLRQAIYDGNKNTIDVMMKELNSRIKEENVSLYSLRVLYNNILRMLISEWESDDRKIEKFYNVFTLSQCVNLKDFCDLLSEACKMIVDYRADKGVDDFNVVKEAIAYMQSNFSDYTLTMNSLAEYLNVRYISLSIEFKNEMAIGPAEYLANLRMEKAKDFLCNSNMRVKEISRAVGYEDEGSFCRRFKKYTGVTPGQYRMDH